MMRRAVAVFLFLIASVAGAREPGFYAGAAINRVNYDVGLSDGILIGIIGGPFSGLFSAPAESSSTDGDTLGWSAMLGYRINRYLAAEVSYIDFGEIANTEVYTPPNIPIRLPVITRTIDVGVRGPALSLLGTLPIGERFDLFVRAGVLFADEKIRFPDLPANQTATYGDELWLAGVGADVSFGSRWTVRFEYQRTDTLDEDPIYSLGEVDLEQLGLMVMMRF